MREVSLWVALLLSACGGGNRVSGTVQGTSLAAHDALARVVRQPCGSLNILITSISPVCAPAVNAKNATSLTLLLAVVSSGNSPCTSAVPSGLGTFALKDSGQGNVLVAAIFDDFNASCESRSQWANTGTVTLSGLNPYSGTFDLTFDSDHLTGSFTAPECTAAVEQNSCL